MTCIFKVFPDLELWHKDISYILLRRAFRTNIPVLESQTSSGHDLPWMNHRRKVSWVGGRFSLKYEFFSVLVTLGQQNPHPSSPNVGLTLLLYVCASRLTCACQRASQTQSIYLSFRDLVSPKSKSSSIVNGSVACVQWASVTRHCQFRISDFDIRHLRWKPF